MLSCLHGRLIAAGVAGLAMAVAGLAHAEQHGSGALTRVDQLGVRTARGDLARIAQTGAIDANKQSGSRKGKAGEGVEGAAAPERSGATDARALEGQPLAPVRPRKDTVDPDEIVRVLDRGDAATLNAASAIATGVVNGSSEKHGRDTKSEQAE